MLMTLQVKICCNPSRHTHTHTDLCHSTKPCNPYTVLASRHQLHPFMPYNTQCTQQRQKPRNNYSRRSSQTQAMDSGRRFSVGKRAKA